MRSALLAAALTLAACGKPRMPQVLFTLPDFEMTAIQAAGQKPFRRQDLLGRVWVVGFIFTSCGGPCPLISTRMAGLARSLPQDVSFLSVTVDPETDTPERLRQYAHRHGADLRRWVFIRGSSAETYRLLYAGFRQTMSADPKAAPETKVIHSTRLVLLDRQAGIRGYYDGLSDVGAAALSRDARLLLEAGS